VKLDDAEILGPEARLLVCFCGPQPSGVDRRRYHEARADAAGPFRCLTVAGVRDGMASGRPSHMDTAAALQVFTPNRLGGLRVRNRCIRAGR